MNLMLSGSSALGELDSELGMELALEFEPADELPDPEFIRFLRLEAEFVSEPSFSNATLSPFTISTWFNVGLK